MKKIFGILLGMGFIFSFVSASGCFHDKIHSVNKAGVVSRGANIRNVACMYGSTKIATLAAGTKVRIIGQTAWTKIVMSDGRIGWIGNNFVSETNDWSNVPAYPANHNVNDYCDTTDLDHCPNPSPKGVTPTWYYRTTPTYNGPVPSNPPAVAPVPKKPTRSVKLTSVMKKAVDDLIETLMEKLEDKMGDDSVAKSEFLEGLISKISKIKVSYKVRSLINYLVEQLEEKKSLFYIDSLLDI